MTDIKNLTQAEIQEIIDNSNHTNYESIKEFHDDGLLEVFPSADDVWQGYGDDEKLTLSTGKVVCSLVDKTEILEKGINWRKLSCTLSSTHDIIDVQDSVQEVMIWTM